ncbi:MAG: dTMP kinase [Deltaproteobacteria bacterium]
MGYFITFEGIEGCGKTTQIKLLAQHLESSGLNVVTTREPGGCAISDKIRFILLDAENSGMCPMAELLLYAAARAQHVNDVILPAIEAGAIVLCDRFSDATAAYQSFGRGIDSKIVDTLNTMACGSISPDLTVLIDCEPETGLARARQRIEAMTGPREERFELESLEFHHRVRAGYLTIAQKAPARFLKIDGNSVISEISTVIADKVQQRFKDRNLAIR